MKLTKTIKIDECEKDRLKKIPKATRYSINTNSTNQNFHEHGKKKCIVCGDSHVVVLPLTCYCCHGSN